MNPSEFESSSSKQQVNIGDCVKVDGKSEHSYYPDCACEECMMKRKSNLQVNMINTDRPVKRQKTGGHLQNDKVIVIREDVNVITNVQHQQVDINAGEAQAQNEQHLSDIEHELQMLRTVFIKSIGNGSQFTFCDYPECGKLLGPDDFAHLKVHTKPFICDFVDCLRRFTSHTTCTVHKRVHSYAFQCDLPGCLKRFKHIDMLKLHKRDHTDPNVIICGFGDCEKVFYSKGRYPAHYLTHSDDGIDKQQFGCDWAQCGRMLTTQFNLSIHRQLHTAERNSSPSHLK